jgi:hypothetical protein
MSEGLVGDRRRQATASIRGYVYQAYQSVLAWMRLGEDEVLFLEGAEDFDVHSAERTFKRDTSMPLSGIAWGGSSRARETRPKPAMSNHYRECVAIQNLTRR